MTREIRHFTADDIPAVTVIEQAYNALYHDGEIFPVGAYLSPAFHNGQDLCLMYEDERLLGYSVCYLVIKPDAPPDIWAEVKVDPTLTDPLPIRNELLDRLIARVRTLTENAPSVELRFQYFPSETAAIDFVRSRGAVRGAASYFHMKRDLAQPLPPVEPIEGIKIRLWRMETEAEQRQYLDARNEAFPDAPTKLEDWQYFLTSPMWAVGGCMAAFEGDALAGSVTIYWDEAENANLPRKTGATEYVFVRDAYRGRGLARALLCAALAHLKAHGLDEAELEVAVENRTALGVYEGLGYRVESESYLYTLTLG
jgi:ribosomal protein S18 acetylase RimI-like enzyme